MTYFVVKVLLKIGMLKYKKVVFYNHGHLGDIFLFLSFIEDIKDRIPAEEYGFESNYSNKKYFYKYFDWSKELSPHLTSNDSFFVDRNTLYVNSWFGKCTSETLRGNCTSFAEQFLKCINDTLIKMKLLPISLKFLERDSYQIDYSSKEIDFKGDILIYNQACYSGQGTGLNYDNLIESILENTPCDTIYTSKGSPISSPRVINLDGLIKDSSLLEICARTYDIPIVVGPLNATIISSWTKRNILNSNKTYFIECREPRFLYHPQQKCSFIYDFNFESITKKICQIYTV